MTLQTRRELKKIKLCGSALIAMAVVIVVVSGPWGAQFADVMRRIDRAWLNERIMDTLARLRGDEDWSRPHPLRTRQDYAWTLGPRPLRIAHALGESGQPFANTLGAMERSYIAELRVFEVDLMLDDGELKCQHEASLAAAPPMQAGCTLDRLIEALPTDAWVMVDLKTAFEPAGLAAIATARRAGRLDRLVFQLYSPAQVALFAAWQAADPALPGPVLTTYLAHRSLEHIVTQAHRLGIHAVALPLARLPALPDDRHGALILIHPVHDCAAAAGGHVDGHYTLRSLHCGAAPPFLERS